MHSTFSLGKASNHSYSTMGIGMLTFMFRHRYALGVATSIMLWMIVKRKPSNIQRRVRQSSQW